MNKQTRDKLARAVYIENRNTAKGIDMIKHKHIQTKNITADMKLFKEIKDGKEISTFFDRIEIREGNKLNVIRL